MNSIIENNNNNILLLFLTIKGIKFGAFLSKEIINNNYYGYKYNRYENSNSLEIKSFIFSINKKKIKYVENAEKIYFLDKNCSNDEQIKEYIINFCSNDLLSKIKNINYINNITNISAKEINMGEKYFNLKELEVFKVSYS